MRTTRIESWGLRSFPPRFCLPVLLVVAFPALATQDEGESNQRLLERWRADPAHYARLQRDLKAFWALPAEKRDRLRQLDHSLHEGEPAVRTRLWASLERYSAWLERLPQAQRRLIENAPDRQEKLRLIRQIRERQWVEHLPRKVQEDLSRLPQEKQPAAVARLRQEERQRVRDWKRLVALRPEPAAHRLSRPTRLTDFPPEVQVFVNDVLKPMLGAEEKEQLKNAEGRWPLLTHTLVELSDRHPVLPPILNGPVILHHQDLPMEMKRALTRERLKGTGALLALHRAEGHWPDYALVATELYSHEGKTPPPLGASRPKEFALPVQ
jgi:hypothetical protein